MGYAFLFHLTGYEPDVPNGRIRLAPQLPSEWNEMSFKGLAYGDSRFDLEVRKSEGSNRIITITTDNDAGFILDLVLPMPGTVASVAVNGLSVEFTAAANSYERMIVKINGIDIQAGTKTEIVVS
jgi:hypothetical protein